MRLKTEKCWQCPHAPKTDCNVCLGRGYYFPSGELNRFNKCQSHFPKKQYSVSLDQQERIKAVESFVKKNPNKRLFEITSALPFNEKYVMNILTNLCSAGKVVRTRKYGQYEAFRYEWKGSPQ